MQDENCHDDDREEGGVASTLEDVQLVVELSGVDEVEDCHHYEDIEIISRVSGVLSFGEYVVSISLESRTDEVG